MVVTISSCIFQYSAKATDEYELARKKVAAFINASESREIVFTRNATEAINLVAYSWGLANLKLGDEVRLFFCLVMCCLLSSSFNIVDILKMNVITYYFC